MSPHCEKIQVPGGGVALVRRSGMRRPKPCEYCEAPHEFLCDHVLRNTSRSRETCDRRLCAKHANQVGEDTHLCPEHQQ